MNFILLSADTEVSNRLVFDDEVVDLSDVLDLNDVLVLVLLIFDCDSFTKCIVRDYLTFLGFHFENSFSH